MRGSVREDEGLRREEKTEGVGVLLPGLAVHSRAAPHLVVANSFWAPANLGPVSPTPICREATKTKSVRPGVLYQIFRDGMQGRGVGEREGVRQAYVIHAVVVCTWQLPALCRA